MNFIIVDTDNITGVFRDVFFGWVYTNNILFHEAFLCGKTNSAPKEFSSFLSSICKNVKIVYYCASSSLPEHADVLCGFSLGRIVEKSIINGTISDVNVYILSNDRLVLSLSNTASEHGLTTFVISTADGKMTIKRNGEILHSVQVLSPQKAFSKIRFS